MDSSDALSRSRYRERRLKKLHWTNSEFDRTYFLLPVSYSPSVVTMAVSVAVCEIFSVKEWHDLENQVRGRSSH